MKKARKWIVRGAVAAVLVAGLVLALLPRPVEVDLATVARGPLEEVVEGQGRTRVRVRHVLSAPVPGYLGRIALRPGDRVKAGDGLAVLTPVAPPPLDSRTRAETTARLQAARAAEAEARAAADSARVEYAQARRDLARYEELRSGGSVTERDLETARTGAEIRDKAVRQAALAADTAHGQAEALRVMLAAPGAPEGGATLQAPADGVVLRVLQDGEGPVAAGTPLIESGDPSDLDLAVDLPTPEAVRVQPGAEARLVRWGGSGELKGRVRLVEPSGFTKVSALGVEEQRVYVIVDPAGAAWGPLGDGFRAETDIVLWRGEDVVTVPEGAVFRRGDGWAVYGVRDGKAALQAVAIGHRDGRHAEVLSGLAPGDTVILFPGDRVSDGVRVAATSRGR